MHPALRTLVSEGPASGEHGGFWADAYPIIPHPGELIFGTAVFAILYLVVAKLVVPRLETMLDERAAAIEGGVANAERLQAAATETLERYRAQLAEVQDEASRIREEARAEGARILAEMREQAQAESARIVADAQTQIRAERQQAMVALRRQTGEIAVDLASRIVGEVLTDEARQHRMLDRFLDELEGMPAGSTGGRG